MEEVKTTEPVAPAAESTVEAPKTLDEIHEAVWSSQDNPSKSETVSEATTESSEKTEAAEPAATQTPSKPEVKQALTPEEEQLLRRNKATDDELDFYRGLPVEQRNRALKPLREAQREKDRYWSLPKEKRAELAQSDAQTFEPSTTQTPSPIETGLKDRIKVDEEILKKVAEKEGIDLERLRELEEQRATRTAASIAPLVQELEQLRDRERRAESGRVISETYAELSKTFPQIKDEKVWKEMVDDPIVVAQATAIYNQTGDRQRAIREALQREVKVRFYNDVRTQSQRELAERGKAALRGTTEKTNGTGRGTGVAKPKPKTLEEIHNAVWESQND